MIGSEAQIKTALQIKAGAIQSILHAGHDAPVFADACAALAAAVDGIEDAAWIISNKHSLGLKVGVKYGTNDPVITAIALGENQLMRDEHWRNPVLRKGVAGFSKEEQARIKGMFQAGWRA